MTAEKNPNQMHFFEHLEELRSRILKSLIIWIFFFIGCFIYSKELFSLLAAPLVQVTGNPSPWLPVQFQEPFVAHLKTAFWSSFIFSSWIFFWHLWAFVSPGLDKSERRFAIPFLSFMALLFMIGCWFSFSLVFPYALEYLIGWNDGAGGNLEAYTRTSYLSMLFAFVFGLGAGFELPLVIFFLAKIGIVTPKFLVVNFKYAVLIIFIIAAIITPTPDFYMQTFLAVPLLVLYWLGVGAAWFVGRKKSEEPEETGLTEDLPNPGEQA